MNKQNIIDFPHSPLSKAKPCPFCDAPNNWLDFVRTERADRMPLFSVFCANCGVLAHPEISRFWAVEKWNRRPAPPPGFFRRLCDRLKGGRA